MAIDREHTSVGMMGIPGSVNDQKVWKKAKDDNANSSQIGFPLYAIYFSNN